MNFALLIPAITDLLKRLIPDKEKQKEAELELQRIINEAEAKRNEAEAKKMAEQAKVIVAEAKSQSFSARNWRPHLMYILMLILPYHFIFVPVLQAFGINALSVPIPNLPDQYWTLLTIGLGGYIAKDTVSSYSSAKFNNVKFFEALRQAFGGKLSQSQVDAINNALNEAKK